MGVLKGICSNAQPMEPFKKGETICQVSDEILDLIVLVSGSAAIYMQVSYYSLIIYVSKYDTPIDAQLHIRLMIIWGTQ